MQFVVIEDLDIITVLQAFEDSSVKEEDISQK